MGVSFMELKDLDRRALQSAISKLENKPIRYMTESDIILLRDLKELKRKLNKFTLKKSNKKEKKEVVEYEEI